MQRKSLSITSVWLLIVFLTPFAWVSNVYSATLEKVRIGQIPERTRVVFDLSDKANYTVQRFSNPSRIVVEFAKTHPEVEFSTFTLKRDKRLHQALVSHTKSSTRVTLRLHKHQDFKYFTLNPKGKKSHRLVVDLIDPKMAKPAVKKAQISPKKNESAANATLKSEPKLSEKKTIQSVKHVDKFVIVIDPGHGGNDSGAIGHNKEFEKHATLAIAKELKAILGKNANYKVLMTRTKDKYVSLEKRADIAIKNKADLFISIHADAFHDHKVDGASVYILNEKGASSEMAERLAQIENEYLAKKSKPAIDKDVVVAINDMTREANLRVSKKIAQSVLKKISSVSSLHKQTVQSANFAVLRTVGVPAILVETAFISNPSEAKKLMQKKFQRKVAKSIASGVDGYLKKAKGHSLLTDTLTFQYKVKRGDNLSMIAERFQVSVQEILKANHIRKKNHLRVGQLLTIPLTESFVRSVSGYQLSMATTPVLN